MTLADKTLHVCNCNGTMPLDGTALAKVLERAGPLPIHTQLCQKELAAFADHAAGDVIVACTQEARLFGDLAEEGGKTQTIRFVNVRETAGWSAESRAATPKIAALLAAAALPEPEPVPRAHETPPPSTESPTAPLPMGVVPPSLVGGVTVLQVPEMGSQTPPGQSLSELHATQTLFSHLLLRHGTGSEQGPLPFWRPQSSSFGSHTAETQPREATASLHLPPGTALPLGTFGWHWPAPARSLHQLPVPH